MTASYIGEVRNGRKSKCENEPFIVLILFFRMILSFFCVCVFFLFILDIKLDVPAGVTQEEGHTGFLIHLPSAVRALIFLARRIQPFLSLVDREVEFCVLTIQSLSTCWAFVFIYFYFLVRKISFTGIRTHVPTCQKVTRLLLSYRGDRFALDFLFLIQFELAAVGMNST